MKPALALALALLAPAAEAGILLGRGEARFELRVNGKAALAGCCLIVIRGRNADPPPILFEERKQLAFPLPEGSYDAIVMHEDLPFDALTYHKIEVKADRTTQVVSNLELYELKVVPVIKGEPSPERVRGIEIARPRPGDRIRRSDGKPIRLAEGRYTVKLTATDASGKLVTLEKTVLLDRDRELRFEL